MINRGYTFCSEMSADKMRYLMKMMVHFGSDKHLKRVMFTLKICHFHKGLRFIYMHETTKLFPASYFENKNLSRRHYKHEKIPSLQSIKRSRLSTD